MSVVFLIIICIISSLLIWQDFSDRSVAVWVLIAFSAVLLAEAFFQRTVSDVFSTSGYNIVFLCLEALVLFVYYFFRYRNAKKLFQSIGGADVWLLLALCVSFSTANYIFFLTFTMILSLVIYIVYRMIFPSATRQIPLAGLVGSIYCGSRLIMYFFSTPDWWNDELIIRAMGA
jgi:hypothetical protein